VLVVSSPDLWIDTHENRLIPFGYNVSASIKLVALKSNVPKYFGMVLQQVDIVNGDNCAHVERVLVLVNRGEVRRE
jgi:hypothetical protein